MLELLLQMNERAGGLNQSLEKIRILRFRLQPKLFQDIMRLVITLLIPTLKESKVTGIVRHAPRRPLLPGAG